MTSIIELLTTSLNAAPGEVLAAMVRVHNTSAGPVTHRATPIGLGDELGDVWKGQALVVPANSVLDLPVQIPVPPSFGIGHHAVAIEVETGADVPVLLPLTLAIASVERVELRATPTPLRGRRKVKFVLDVVNREPHTVELLLESETPDVDVSFEMPTMTLGPGQQSWTRGRVRGPRKLVGDRTQHNLKLVARGRAASSSIAVPYIQRPVFAYRLRSAVAVAAVLALWMGAMVLVSQRYVFNKTNDDVSAPTTSVVEPAGDDGSVPIPGAADAGTGDGSDGTADSGDSPGEASASDEPGGDGSGDAGGDDGSGDAGGGDAGGGDGSGDAGDGSGDGTDEAGSPDGTEGPTADTPVEVRGTIDVAGGSIDGVTITPAPMSLKNVAELDPNVTSFAATSRPEPRKIWSARGIIAPVEPVRLAQTEPIPAGDFAPDVDGIWALPLAQRQAYELAFSKPGFQTQAFVITPELGNTPELAVELEPATGELGGVVTGGGRPLENVVLLITTGTFDYETVTDGNGRWALTGLDTSAHYTIVASLDGYGAAVRRVRLAPGEPQTNVSIALPFGQSVLQGVVTDTSGAKIRGAKVTASNGAESRSTTTLTDEDESSGGRYQLPQLETNATYSVTIEFEGYETATAKIRVGSVTQVENFTLKALAAPISGRVTSTDGAPIGGATVTLDIDTVMQPISSVQTIREGDFSLGLVPPGRYRLTVVQWQHEPARGELVVTSASQSSLAGESGPSFSIEMTPLPPRLAADRPTGSLAFDVLDSNTNVTCAAGDCRRINNTVVKITTTDPSLINSARITNGVFQCPTDTGECNTTNETEYRVEGIPIGAYTVLFEHPDFNTTAELMTVVPGGGAAAEEILMIRKGEVNGALLDSATNETVYLPELVWVVPAGPIIPGCAPGVVTQAPTACGQFAVPTEYVENPTGDPADQRFQSSSLQLLRPGTYGLQVVEPDGYRIADGQVLVPGEAPFTFVIRQVLGSSNSVALTPIFADRYPTINVRLFKPATDVSTDVTFEPFTETPSAAITCGSLVESATTVTATTVTFDQAATQRLDPNGDGDFGVCSLAVNAPNFERTTYSFGGTHPELVPGTDRFVDVALLATPAVGHIDDLVGLLSWTNTGSGSPESVPIPGAQISATSVVTAILGGEHSSDPGAGPPAVTAAAPEDLTTQFSIAPSGVADKATWNAWQGIEQVIGTSTVSFSATGFPDTSLTLTVDGAGVQTFTPTDASDLMVDTSAGTIDVTLSPQPGQLLGNVSIVTGDADPAVFSDLLMRTRSSSGAVDPLLHTEGSYDEAVAAGSWVTTLEALPFNHRPLSPVAQINSVDPSKFLPKTQFVPAGSPSLSYDVELLELGLANMTVAGPTGGVEYSVDGGTPLALATPQVISALEVPVDGVSKTNHTIRLTKAAGFDLERATVTVTQTYRQAADEAVDLATLPGLTLNADGTVDLTQGLPLAFAAGTKYDVDVSLPAYGTITGTVLGTSARLGPVEICSSGTAITATITATPTKVVPQEQFVIDPLTGLPVQQSVNVTVDDPDRSVLSVDTCDDFVIAGEVGEYRLEIEHPEFADIAAQQVQMPAVEDTLALPVAESTLTILPSRFVVEAKDSLAGPNIVDSASEVVYFTLDTAVGHGAPVRMPNGIADLVVDPSSGYTLTVRGCAAAPADRAEFDLCVNRFPAIVLLVVPRSTDLSQQTADAIAILLQVGGKIDLALSFENVPGREVCPTPNTVPNFERSFDRSQNGLDQAVVNSQPTDIASGATEVVAATCTTGTAAAPTVDTVEFRSVIASGTHTLRLPEVAGFGAPVLTAGTGYTVVSAPGTVDNGYYTAEISYQPSSFASPATIPVRYEAARVDVAFHLCGRNTDDSANCDEEFPGLLVTLISPALGETAATVGTLDSVLGYPISAVGLDPETTGYTVSIDDDIHQNPASALLAVTAGTQADQTITFQGASVRVAINPQETFGDKNNDVRGLTPTGTVTLSGRSSGSATWTSITSSWVSCRINGTDYDFCADVAASYDEFRVVVAEIGYLDGIDTGNSPGVGRSVVLEPNSVKRAIVRINATVKNAAGAAVNFPSTLIDNVKLVRDDNVMSPVGDRLPSNAACNNAGVQSACFDFYADPGYNFQAVADSQPQYILDTSTPTAKRTKIGGTVRGDSTVSIEFIPATVPDVPKSVAATVDDTQSTVSWAAPDSNGGSTITQYTVTSSPGSGTCNAQVAGAGSCIVTGLANGTEYTFSVVATNAIGNSAAASVTATPATVPDVPKSVAATVDDTQSTVSWAAPDSNGGSTITQYTVTSSPGSGTCNAQVAGDGSCIVTGLTNGTEYTFSVVATNAIGNSAAASVTATPATVPDVPKSVAATVDDTQSTVSWAAPDSNGGSTITQYTVTSSPGSGTCNAQVAGAGSCIVTGLANGTEYTFSVVATNGIGPSAAASVTATPETP